jgi:predicted transcriptional regulator
MPADETSAAPDLVALAGDVVAAYVAKNAVQRGDLPVLIVSVHAALAGLGKPQSSEPEKPTPRIPIRKSITPDHLISLEDGRKYRTLKRHLAGRGLTPEQYRIKWGLPADYPMTAPSYSKQRSKLALDRGLGRKAGAKTPAKATAAKHRSAGSRNRGK